MNKIALVILGIIIAGHAGLSRAQDAESFANNAKESAPMTLTSPVFAENGVIPSRYTCAGLDINPPLDVRNVPAETRSLTLIVHDSSGLAGEWVHWIVYNMPVKVSVIHEKSVPGTEGLNDFGNFYYGGPCPADNKMHTYQFSLYALDSDLDVAEGATRETLLKAMNGRILAAATLNGTSVVSQTLPDISPGTTGL